LLDKLIKLSHQKNKVKYVARKLYSTGEKIKGGKLDKRGPITIISNNCVGGFLYQKYGMKYYSPTIGLQFTQEGFIKLCKHFEYYINEELKESENKAQKDFIKLGGEIIHFPVGKLGDITIYFQHYNYKSFEEAKKKWDERKTRINKERMFFIFIGYDNTPVRVLRDYDTLPIKHKLLLTNERRIISKDTFEIHNGKNTWFDETDNIFGLKYYERFNFYKWFKNS
jgi:uncharacterized protein (DUF1919 family)